MAEIINRVSFDLTRAGMQQSLSFPKGDANSHIIRATFRNGNEPVKFTVNEPATIRARLLLRRPVNEDTYAKFSGFDAPPAQKTEPESDNYVIGDRYFNKATNKLYVLTDKEETDTATWDLTWEEKDVIVTFVDGAVYVEPFSDNTGNYNPLLNRVDIPVTTEMLNMAGNFHARVVVSENGSVLFSPEFQFAVLPNEDVGRITATDEITAIDNALAALVNATGTLDTQYLSLEAVVSNNTSDISALYEHIKPEENKVTVFGVSKDELTNAPQIILTSSLASIKSGETGIAVSANGTKVTGDLDVESGTLSASEITLDGEDLAEKLADIKSDAEDYADGVLDDAKDYTDEKLAGDIAPQNVNASGDIETESGTVKGMYGYIGDEMSAAYIQARSSFNSLCIADDGSSVTFSKPLIADSIEADSIGGTNNHPDIVANDITVHGTLNVVNVEETEVEHVATKDEMIRLRKDAESGIASGDISGLVAENYNGMGDDMFLGVDENGEMRVGEEGSLEPLLTRAELDDLQTDGVLLKWENTNKRAVSSGKTVGDLALASDLDAVEEDVSDLQTDVAGKQDKLTAGTNITIDENNVISAAGGGGGDVEIVTLNDNAVTMSDIEVLLAEINTAGRHVFFDTSFYKSMMYLVTIYCDTQNKFCRISDLVTGIEKKVFYKGTDLLKDILNTSSSSGKHYTFVWDKVNAKGTRLNDASNITTTTTNFGHFGSVNTNKDNPFDSIYPWSERKLCNVDLDAYSQLTAGDDITDCVTAWEGDDNFDYNDECGVWVYTPAFFGRSFEAGSYRYFDVTDELTQGNISYPAMITGRWHGCRKTLTIGGVSTANCFVPLADTMPSKSYAMSTMHSEAKKYNGQIVDIYQLDASLLLMVVEYATMNSQTAIGNGVSNLYTQSGYHLLADVSASDTITVTKSVASYVIPGAIIDIGTSDGGAQVGSFYVVSTSDSGDVRTVTLDRAVTATTAHFWSIHGKINTADEGIGSDSGYIGSNGQSIAYYRGEELYANLWQYILGAYREKDTEHIWLCDRGHCNEYDALNTSVHTDTGLKLPVTGYVKTLGIANGLACAPFCTEVGGNSTNPVGDYYYVPSASTGNTVLLLGGSTSNGAIAGPFYGYWDIAASYSYWDSSARPSLKTP